MKILNRIESKATVIFKDNIDTDILIPKNFLKTIKRTGFSQGLFYPWRYDDKGVPLEDFPLNQEENKDNKILIVGENFGCGSSREHAAWALEEFGFRVVLAGSFSPIFYNNFLNNLNLPLVLDKKTRLALAACKGTLRLDLSKEKIWGQGIEVDFNLDPAVKEKLLKGQDAIDEILTYTEQIQAYERKVDHGL